MQLGSLSTGHDDEAWSAPALAPAAVGALPLRGLWAHWNAARRGGDLPGRATIDPLALRPWLGRLLLMDVIDNGRDFRYRLHGTALVELFGADLTGTLVSALPVADVDRLLAEGRAAVARRDYVYIEEAAVAERRYAAISKLILPLATTGSAVDMLMVGISRTR